MTASVIDFFNPSRNRLEDTIAYPVVSWIDDETSKRAIHATYKDFKLSVYETAANSDISGNHASETYCSIVNGELCHTGTLGPFKSQYVTQDAAIAGALDKVYDLMKRRVKHASIVIEKYVEETT